MNIVDLLAGKPEEQIEKEYQQTLYETDWYPDERSITGPFVAGTAIPATTNLPAGGKDGQYLAKKTDIPYEVEWRDLPEFPEIPEYPEIPEIPSYLLAISQQDIMSWNNKQEALMSGVNIKTINGQSVLGEGDLNAGDTVPIDSIFEYEGDTVPEGYAVVPDDYIKTDSVARVSNVVSKNLFDAKKIILSRASISYTDDGFIISSSEYWGYGEYFATLPAGTYTLSGDVSGNVDFIELYINGNWVNGAQSHTFNLTSESEIKIVFYATTGHVSSGSTTFSKVQLEEGPIVTSYAPYLNLREAMREHKVYSTSEQIIGTSVNGKPLYAITLLGTTINGDLQINIANLNIEKIRDISGATGVNGDFRPINFYFSGYSISTRYAHGVLYINSSDVYAGYPFEVTIEYTKTTD